MAVDLLTQSEAAADSIKADVKVLLHAMKFLFLFFTTNSELHNTFLSHFLMGIFDTCVKHVFTQGSNTGKP